MFSRAAGKTATSAGGKRGSGCGEVAGLELEGLGSSSLDRRAIWTPI